MARHRRPGPGARRVRGHLAGQHHGTTIPAAKCEGLSQAKCHAAYTLAGLDPAKCDAHTGVGCLDGPVYPPSSAVTPAAPSPVSTDATLTSMCTMGYENTTIDNSGNATFDYDNSTLGTPQGVTIQGNYYAPALAYELTLGNTSQNTANVTGFAVVFYDSTGSEAGSDQQGVGGGGSTFITAGQSLTWTELSSTALDGTGAGGYDGSIPANAATCNLVQWYHG
jgi:hypothetical protein